MPSIVCGREIVAEPDQVWKVITDLELAPKIVTGIEKIERLTGPGYEVGTRWRETRRILGKTETEEMWVEAIDPGKSTTVVSEARGARFVTVFRVLPSSLGSRLEMEFSAEPTTTQGFGQKMLMAMFSGAGMKATKRVLEQDLADIAAWMR